MIRKLWPVRFNPIILIYLLTINGLSLQTRDDRSWLSAGNGPDKIK